MARIENSTLGEVSGKVGDIIVSSWKGIRYIKSRPTDFHDAKTPAQLAHRLKLQMAHRFVKSTKEYIEIGFRQITEHQSPYNKAVSYIMKNAIEGEYPKLHIEPNKVTLSLGDLASTQECTISKEEDTKIAFSWETNHIGANDTALLIAYNFSKYQAKTSQSYCKEKYGIIELPDNWKGDKIGCYIFFASNTDNKVSNSLFLGMIP